MSGLDTWEIGLSEASETGIRPAFRNGLDWRISANRVGGQVRGAAH